MVLLQLATVIIVLMKVGVILAIIVGITMSVIGKFKAY